MVRTLCRITGKLVDCVRGGKKNFEDPFTSAAIYCGFLLIATYKWQLVI